MGVFQIYPVFPDGLTGLIHSFNLTVMNQPELIDPGVLERLSAPQIRKGSERDLTRPMVSLWQREGKGTRMGSGEPRG